MTSDPAAPHGVPPGEGSGSRAVSVRAAWVERAIGWLLEHPVSVLAVLFVVTAALGAVATRVEIDNTAAVWLPARDPELDRFRAFRERFGDDAFTIAATAPVAVDDDEVLEALGRVRDALTALDGVERVDAPLASGGTVAEARADLERWLGVLADARRAVPGDEHLALLEAEVAVVAGALRESSSPARARDAYRRAQASALAGLAVREPDRARALAEGADPDLASVRDDAVVAAVFWWAFARGAEVRVALADDEREVGEARVVDLVADLAPVDDAMRWVLEHDADLAHGGPDLYFALRRSTGVEPADASAALRHFEAVERISGGRALMARVLRAERHAPTLATAAPDASDDEWIAAARHAWDTFHALLESVVSAPYARDELTVLNAVARDRARELLRDPESVLPAPPDVAWETPADDGRAAPPALGLTGRPLAGVLVAADRLALFVVPVEDLDAVARTALVGRVEGVLAGAAPELGPWDVIGTDVLTRDLDRGSRSSFGRLFPAVLVAMALVLQVVLRSARCVAAIGVGAGVASTWTLGLVALSGRSLNLILVVMPAIVVVVSTAYALHLVTRYLQLEPLPHDARGAVARDLRRARWREAAAGTFVPCLLTAVTTAAGFASLASSDIAPVRDLGSFMAFGALTAFALTFVFLPTVLALSPRVVPRPHEQRRWTLARAAAATTWLARRRPWILAAGLALAGCAAIGVGRLRVESHVLDFFAANHPLPASYRRIESAFSGATRIELWLEGERSQVLSARALDGLDAVLTSARNEPYLSGTRPLRPFDTRFGALPGATLAALLDAWLPADTSTADLEPAVRSFVWSGAGRVALRTTLACPTGSADGAHALVERLRAEVRATELPAGVELRVSGSAPLLVRGQTTLLRTQLTSFALALGVVTLVLACAFRSARLVAISVVSNVLPVGTTLGFMGWVGIPLDTATVTVAGIALGLVVDDTIHFLHAVRDADRAGGHTIGTRGAVAEALARVGPPIFTTSVALAVGFGAFAVAEFRPTYFFGLLIALTGVAALVCTVVLLPALLLRRREDDRA